MNISIVHISTIQNNFIYFYIFYFDRWNSTFDSVLQIITLLKNDPEKINQCLDYCDLQRLTEDEIIFIEEYCEVRF